MKPETKLKVLKYLMVFGGVFILIGMPLMSILMPDYAKSAWGWEPAQPEYEGMMFSILVALGLLAIWAARDPIRHISLVYFAILSGFLHGGAMVIMALIDEGERMNFLGDIPYTLGFSVLLLVFIPWKLLKQEQKKA